MLRVLGRARSAWSSGRAWFTLLTPVLLWGGFVGSAIGQITNLNPGESIKLSHLLGAGALSLQVGDKLFSDFGFGYVDTDSDAGNDLQSSMVLVSPLYNPDGLGLRFQLPLVAFSNVFKDVALSFSVEVVNSGNLISDAHLGFTSSVLGVARADVSETIFTNGFGVGAIASLSVGNPGNPAVFSDSVVFSKPQAKIWVEKDISAFAAGSGINDFAGISIVNQTFSQIPEPSTLALSVVALTGLSLVTRRPRQR